MAKQMIVHIEKYGDDAPYVELTMLAPQGATNEQVSALVKEANEIFADTNDADKAKMYLFTWGFTYLKAYSITIGGNL